MLIVNCELFLDFQRIECQIESTDSHDEDGTERAHHIGHNAHAKREDGSSEKSHAMIIRPEISFLCSGSWLSAWAKQMEKIFELPNPTRAIPV